MRRWLIPVLLLPLWWLFGWAQAQPRPELADPRFESVGDATAISDGVVSTLIVDRNGFLWIGTAIGLVRYDGYSFVSFRPPIGEQGPQTSFVRSLLVGRDGLLWVGTDSDGMARFDPVAQHWTVFKPGEGEGRMAKGTVRALVEDGDGTIWAGTVGGGLQRLDPRSERFTRYGTEQGLPDARVQSLLIGRDGTLWVGSWGGLAWRRPGATRFEMVPGTEAIAGDVITLLHEDLQGRLWIGTQEGELLRLEAGGLRWLDRSGRAGGAVQALVEMEDGELWLGRANGIEIRYSADGSLQRLLRYSVNRPWGPAGSDVRVMVKDPSGVLWVGSYGGGLQRHVPNGGAIWVRRGDGDERSVLGVVDVRSLVELDNGEIWIGTNDRGVAVLDRQLRLLHSFPVGQGGYRGGRAGGIAQAANGLVWVGSDAGVSLFDPRTRRWVRDLPVGKGRVRVIRALPDGGMLVGTQDGVYRWQPGDEGPRRLRLGDGAELFGDINAVAVRGDGGAWVGGERGLFDLPAGAAGLLPVPPVDSSQAISPVLGLLVDRRGQLWLDSVSGLHRLVDRQGGRARFEHISARIGLAGQSFGANLLEDSGGRIWTHRGVYDPARQRFDGIAQADGVDIGTGWFRAYLGLRDGRLLFGGSRGLMVLEPRRFTPWRFAPPVLATELFVDGKPAPLARLQPTLRLAPGERSFAIGFAALDLSQPSRNRHRFRLDGLHQEWTEVQGDQRVAAFGGLAPGAYTLQVQGSNRNGDWSPDALVLPIEVLPDWWQTWWARSLLLLPLLGLLALAVQLRTRALRRRQAELEARVQQRTEQLEALSEALRDKTKALEASALTDPLTGLHNRRFVMERLSDDVNLMLRRYEEAARLGQPPPDDADLCFFLIDIDRFKQVNDQFGHAAGDAVLVQMRERLQEVFRAADYLVRWGGEEFLVVARGMARSAAPELAERIRQAVGQRPFLLGEAGQTGRVIQRSCSVGFACLPLLPQQPRAVVWATVLNLADAALYAAKREGRNRWVGVLDGHGLSAEQLRDALGDGGTLPEGLSTVRSP